MSTIKAESWRTLNDEPVEAFAQVVTTQKTDIQNITGPTTADVMSVTITPRYADSKILLLLMVNYMVNGHGGIQILKNGTLMPEFSGDLLGYSARNSAWSWDYGTTSYNTVYDCRCHNGEILDTAGTTSPITYTVRMNMQQSGYIGLNYNAYNDADASYTFRTASCITAIEVLQGN